MAQKKSSYQKKFPSWQKKVSEGFRGFCTYFWEVDRPICDVWKQKLKFLIEFLDGTKKVQQAAKRSFLLGKKSFQRV